VLARAGSDGRTLTHERAPHGERNFVAAMKDRKYNQNKMNTTFTSYITASPARASRYAPAKEHGTFEKVRTGTSTTLKWDSGKGALAASKLSHTRNIFEVKKVYPECFDMALLMYQKLKFHRENYAPQLPDPIDIVVRCLGEGPSFAEQYSDMRKRGRFNWLGMNFVQDEPERALPMKSYYDSYDVSSFIFWTEESTDYKWMRMGVPDSDQEYLDMVKQFAAELSEDLLTDEEIAEDIPLSLLHKPTASGAFDANDPLARTIPEWSLEYDNPDLDGEIPILICKRSEAPKKPGETRDIGVMDPRSMRRHRRFMWLLQRACSRIESSPHGKDYDKLIEIVKWIDSGNFRFYMRDYAKSGMTVPHAVIRAVFEGFYERRPELGEMAAHWYEGSRIYFDEIGKGEYFHPDTGCPLGYFVEGYTILQYIIHRINMMSMRPSCKPKFSGTNDDMVVGFREEQDVIDYINVDMGTNSSLGMAYKQSKSGWASNFVYCEEYMVDGVLQRKDSLYAGGVLSALLAINIIQAKDHVYSILLATPEITPRVQAAVGLVQSHFGWEFNEQEIEWPYLFGGWLPQYKDGLDHSIKWFNGDASAAAAYWACREDIHVPKKFDEDPHLALGRAFDIRFLEFPEGRNHNFLDLITLVGNKDTLTRHYMRSSISPKAVAREYRGLQKKRSKYYKSVMEGHKNCPDIYENWLVRHPNSVIPRWLPGVKFVPVLQRGRYSTGLPRDTFLSKLCFMAKKGWITSQLDKSLGLRPTHIHYMKMGISSQLDGETLYIPEGGMSQWVLCNQPRGLRAIFEESAETIINVGPEDVQLPETMMFLNGNAINLVDSKRYARFLKEWGSPVTQATLSWVYDIKTGAPIPDEIVPEPERVETIPDEVERKTHEQLRAWIYEITRGMLGSVERHVSNINPDLSAKDNEENPELPDPDVSEDTLSSNNVLVLMGATLESEENSHSESEESIPYDIWDEIGGG